jgi:hypothetical protein
MFFKQVPFVIEGIFSVETVRDNSHDDASNDGAKTAAADTLHLNGLGGGKGEGYMGRDAMT